MCQAEEMDLAITTWYEYWEGVYEGGFHVNSNGIKGSEKILICYLERGLLPASFERSSLSLQRDYAFIIASSNLIGKLVKEAGPSADLEANHELRDIVDLTLERLKRLLKFIAEDQAYSWHLRWAPTYSAIFPVFVGETP